jgi:uncharacterized protein Smg (DUF494 family)
MDERLAHLLSRLRERFPADVDVAEVEAYLSSEGYDRRQIGEIVSALMSEVSPRLGGRSPVAQVSMPFRIIGPHEMGRFTPEAWGHLLSLASGGLITAAEMEAVIDRATSQIEGRINLEDLRQLMESGGFDEFGPAPDHLTVH